MKMWKRMLSMALSLVLLIAAFPVSALAEENIDAAASKEPITLDLGEDTCSFDDAVSLLGTVPSEMIVKDGITRAEWMRDLVLLFDMSITADEYPDIYFPDITESTAYFDEIMIAVKYGAVSIEAGDNFEPDAVLTREFAAQTLNYCLGMQNDSETYTYNDTDAVEYPDDAQVAIDLGWFALIGGNFAPMQEVTADEITAMVNSVQAILDERDIGSGTADYLFADYVKVIPETATVDSFLDFDTETTTITISDWDGALAVGDTFAFYAEDYAFVYGVEQVVDSDGVISVITADAPAGAILDYDYAGELDLELTPDLRNNEPVTLMSADGDEVHFDKIQLMGSSKHEISFSRDFTKGDGLGIKGKLKGTVKDLKLDTKFIGGNKHFILSGKLEVSSTIELDLLDDPVAAALKLGGVSIGPFGYVGLEINLKMEAKIGYTLSSEFKLGLDYQNGYASWIKEMNSKDSCLTASGGVSARLALAAHLDFGANGSASISLGAGPKIDLKAKKYSTGTPLSCITIAGYFNASFEVKVKLKEVFSGKTVFEYKYTYEFWNEKNSPIRIYTHVEDGVEVSECTRGKDPGTADPGYVTPKYITPSNSKYYGGGSNVSSSGYGGYGSTTPVVIWETSDNDDGTVTITGYKGSASVLNIPETIDGKTVTVIGTSAFRNNKTIRMVMIPDTITMICSQAFEGCVSLKEIAIPEGVTTLGSLSPGYTSGTLGETFSGCTSLESIYIPSTLEECKASIFRNCTALRDIEFGDGITKICDHLFMYCLGITQMDIPDTVTSIGSNAFSHCENLTSITIPDTVTSIGTNAFYNCKNLSSITIPDSVTYLGNSSFKGCSKLSEVNLGESLTMICGCAFEGCVSLKEIAIPEGVTTLGGLSPEQWSGYVGSVFADCTSLEQIYIPSTLEECAASIFQNCTALHNIEFGDGITKICDNLFMYCPGITQIAIPDTVTSIGTNAFYNCENLSSITIPDSVTYLGNSSFKGCSKLSEVNLGESLTMICGCAFEGCVSLKEIAIPEGVTTLGSLSPGQMSGTLAEVFSGCTSLEYVYIPSTLETCTFANFKNCTALDSIKFGEGISAICDCLFMYCPGITQMDIPDTVTSIGSNAFSHCENLTSITIPDTVTSIGTNAFYNCENLSSITIPDSVISYGGSIFQNCSALAKVKLPDNVLDIPASMFSGCTSLKTVEMPDGITEIKYNTFQNCAALTDLSFLPDTVTTIGSSAFNGCVGLTSANLPDLVSKLDGSAFKGCTSLVSFKAGSDLLTIGANCFQDCSKLTDIDLNDGLTTIGNYAFQNCAALQTVVLPDSVTSLGTYAFQKDPKLVNVTLSAGLKEIPSYAFANCTSMTELVIPTGVTSIAANAFYQDTKLKTFTIPASVTSIGSNAFSYATTTTVYGVAGSYVETYAKWKSFIDITKPITKITLANGTNAMTIGRSLTVTPKYTISPSDSTDFVKSLTSDNTNVVSVRNNTQLYGSRAGTANITATTYGGQTYTFTVTVDTLSGIEITQLPDTTEYGLKEDKDTTGLVVSAVFANGSKEPIYDYTLSGFTTDTLGTHTVTAAYSSKTASFPITVSVVASGTMGNADELRWSYSSGSGQIAVTGSVSASEPVYVAVYDKNGRMIGITAISMSGGKANVGNDFACVKLIWVDMNAAPKCASAEIETSE